MTTICLKTDQSRLITHLRHAFNPSSMLGELLKNARRAKAGRILVEVDGRSLTVSDDGVGIADLQTLIYIAQSGWDQETQEREHAFGLGVLSTLYFAEHLSVRSGRQAFSASTASILRGEAIAVEDIAPCPGTTIRLQGVQLPHYESDLHSWVIRQLERLCRAFPVMVFCNGIELARPLANPDLPWRETPIGRVLIDLDARLTGWQCFLQGLPIGKAPFSSHHHVVLLQDGFIARLPDRQSLLNADTDLLRIERAIEDAYRHALIDAREQLSPGAFLELHSECCLDSGNADLLNDIRLAQRSWFRDWEKYPPSIHWMERDDEWATPLSDDTLLTGNVWRIASDDNLDQALAEVYLRAKGGYLLEETRLDAGHWLMVAAKVISPQQLRVQCGPVLYRDESGEFVDLELVASLHVRLEDEAEALAVEAVREGRYLYLTGQASPATVIALVSDYIGCSQNRSDIEAAIRNFIAIGRSQSPEQVIEALLPRSLRDEPQPKLAGATVRLSFDDDGRLQAVRA